MAGASDERNIQTRAELFDFLQSQMQTAYRDLKERQRLESESTLIKSYVFEVDLPEELAGSKADEMKLRDFAERVFSLPKLDSAHVEIKAKGEEGFFEIYYSYKEKELVVYLDVATNRRFWEAFSISKSEPLDAWFNKIVTRRSEF